MLALLLVTLTIHAEYAREKTPLRSSKFTHIFLFTSLPCISILVVGAKSCGKTSFIEFLRNTLNRPIRLRPNTPSPPPASPRTEAYGAFTSRYLETELGGERIGLTLYDSTGFERHLVDLQLRELSSFVESKFQDTFNEEQKVLRATGVLDTHIHCVFLILDPSRLDSNLAASKPKSFNDPKANQNSKQRTIGGLDEDLDVDVIRTLQGKTTVIPVISKADTITTAHMSYLKRTVWDALKKIKFDPLEGLGGDSDNESDYDTANEASVRGSIDGQATAGQGNKQYLDPSKPPQHDDIRVSRLSETVDLPDIPMSIISPDVYEPGIIGRRFPWGFADPMNADHCDFVRLKDSVFSEWRSDLRTASRDKWYEGWRTNRLRTRGSTPNRSRPILSSQRGVSAAGAQPGVQPANGGLQQHRTVSGPIGVAIGDESGLESNHMQGHFKGHTMH